MRFLIVSILFIAAVSAPPAGAEEPIVSVPYRVDYTGWFTVSATVNGEGPYDFIIDTGATQSLVFQNLADSQNFSATGGPPQMILGLATQGAFDPYLIGDIAIGGAALTGLETVILPDWSVEQKPQGIIGLDLLKDYVMLFDAEAGMLHLYDHAAPPPGGFTRRWRRAGLEAENFGLDIDNLYTVTGRVSNRSVTFLLDLGASGTVVNRAAASSFSRRGVSIRIIPSGSEARARISDVFEESADAQSVVANRIRIGRNTWYRHILVVHDAPIFDELGVQEEPFGLFGADLVRERSFMLDFRTGEMRIGPRARS